MMPFRKLDPRSRRAIGYATLTYACAVLLLLVFAGAAISATDISASPPPLISAPAAPAPATATGSAVESAGLFGAAEDPTRLLAGILALLLAGALLVYTRRSVMRML